MSCWRAKKKRRPAWGLSSTYAVNKQEMQHYVPEVAALQNKVLVFPLCVSKSAFGGPACSSHSYTLPSRLPEGKHREIKVTVGKNKSNHGLVRKSSQSPLSSGSISNHNREVTSGYGGCHRRTYQVSSAGGQSCSHHLLTAEVLPNLLWAQRHTHGLWSTVHSSLYLILHLFVKEVY